MDVVQILRFVFYIVYRCGTCVRLSATERVVKVGNLLGRCDDAFSDQSQRIWICRCGWLGEVAPVGGGSDRGWAM